MIIAKSELTAGCFRGEFAVEAECVVQTVDERLERRWHMLIAEFVPVDVPEKWLFLNFLYAVQPVA